MPRKKQELEITPKSISLFDDDAQIEPKKRQSKTNKNQNDKIFVKSLKRSPKQKETSKSVSKTTKIKNNDNNQFNNISNSNYNDSLSDISDTQKKRRNTKTKIRPDNTIQESANSSKRNIKSKKVGTRRDKTVESSGKNSKRIKGSEFKKDNKPKKSNNTISDDTKQKSVINITKTRIEKERKQYTRETIGSQVQLSEKPKKTNDDFLIEIELKTEKILVSPWSVDENNVYCPGKDSEFLVHRFRPSQREEEKRDEALDAFNKKLKTKFKTWEEASTYSGDLSESILSTYADKLDWIILFQTRDMEKYSAKFKKKFKSKYALKAILFV